MEVWLLGANGHFLFGMRGGKGHSGQFSFSVNGPHTHPVLSTTASTGSTTFKMLTHNKLEHVL